MFNPSLFRHLSLLPELGGVFSYVSWLVSMKYEMWNCQDWAAEHETGIWTCWGLFKSLRIHLSVILRTQLNLFWEALWNRWRFFLERYRRCIFYQDAPWLFCWTYLHTTADETDVADTFSWSWLWMTIGCLTTGCVTTVKVSEMNINVN